MNCPLTSQGFPYWGDGVIGGPPLPTTKQNFVYSPHFYPHQKKKKNNFMAPFYGWGSTASRLEPLQ